MAYLHLPEDRLDLDGGDLITYGATILNIVELYQDDVPRFRNTEVSGLDRGRPEQPAMDPRPVTLSGLIIGECDLTLPTPATYSYLRGGALANWADLQAIFAQQFDTDTLIATWRRLDETGGQQTVTAEVQVGNWQITGDFDIEFTYTFELTRFSDWEESS